MTVPADTQALTMRPTPNRWIGLAVLCASLLIVVMDLTILNVALPAIATDLRPSSTQLLWMVDVYGLAVAGFLVMASGLADRYGRRRILLIGYAIFGSVPLLVLVADTPNGLIALRALLGLGGAFIMPSTMSMIRDLFVDAKERAFALGIWATMAAVGGGLGPILGGVLVQSFGWHAAFLFNTPIMAVAAVVSIWLLPVTRGSVVPWDVPSIVLSITGMVALMYAIKTFGKNGIEDSSAIVAVGVAVLSLAWFVRRCLRRSEPLLDIRLLRRPELSAGLLCALASSIAMAAIMLLLAQWMQLVAGYSPISTGLHLLPVAIVSGVLSPLAPKIAGVIGVRTVTAGGLLVGGLGFTVLSLADGQLSFPLVAISQSLVGVSLATLAVGSAVILSATPAKRSGNAAALEETSFDVGSALGVAILGSVAALMFRDSLTAGSLAKLGVPDSQSAAARESIGGAMSVAQHMPHNGSVLAAHAQTAFTDALGVAGLVGGVIMLLSAIAVWFMTPPGLSLVDSQH